MNFKKQKIIYLILSIFIISGCSYNATPEERMAEREKDYKQYYDKQMDYIKSQEERAQRADY